ncbi:hypothetical protein B484DRAFT_438644, partial [Ochromonadaceae sp. CCMP2298]
AKGWLSVLNTLDKSAVVVMNKGAHYTEDGYYTQELVNFIAEVRAVLPLAKFVFRSSSLGSVHCANHTLPLTEYPSEVEDCLHFCQPGPVDFWNQALFNWLVLEAETPQTASQ